MRTHRHTYSILLAPNEVEGGTLASSQEDAPLPQVSDAEANAALAAQSRATAAEANSSPIEEGGKLETMKVDSDFDFNEFTTTKDGSRDANKEPTKLAAKVAPKTEVKPKTGVEEKEEIKAPEIEEEEVEEVEEPEKEEVEELSDEEKKQQLRDPRDYSGLTKAEKLMFRKMGRESYEKLRPIYEEHKKLVKENAELKAKGPVEYDGNPDKLPANYLEHPDAVTLLPDFKENQQIKNMLEFEKDFWQKQKLAVKQGKKGQMLGRDAQGKYIITGELEPTVENEEMLAEKVNQASMFSNQVDGKLQQIVGGFKARHEQAVTSLRQAEAKFFPFFEKDLDKNPLKKDIDLALNSLPPVFRGHPMAILLGKSYATTTYLAKKNKELETKLASMSSKREDAINAGPTKAQIQARGGGNGKDEPDIMAEFNAVKNRD